MKKSFCFIFCVLLVSCKKDDTVQLRFTPSIHGEPEYVWHWDSILYTTIHYSYASELKTTEEYNNPEVYHHSVNIDTRIDYIEFTKGQVCILKKFDIVSNSGGVLFYLPYNEQPGSEKAGMKLPFPIVMKQSMSLYVGVIRYPKE